MSSLYVFTHSSASNPALLEAGQASKSKTLCRCCPTDLPSLVVPLAMLVQQVLAWGQMAVKLHPEFLCNSPPSFVPLPFELAQVYRRDGQVRVIQETADVLDAFTSVSAELCR